MTSLLLAHLLSQSADKGPRKRSVSGAGVKAGAGTGAGTGAGEDTKCIFIVVGR